MIQTMKMVAAGLATALAFAIGAGSALAANGAMGKDAYKAAQNRIEQQGKAQAKACGRLKANAKDVCQAQAKGDEAAAEAQLTAQYKPSPSAERDAKMARADADYAVAREKCDDVKDRARNACLRKAKDERDAADRLAKVEKVETVGELKARAAELRKDGPQPARSLEARYASAKAHCIMKGEERDRCLDDAKRRFQKS
jgi:hypothetical protein